MPFSDVEALRREDKLTCWQMKKAGKPSDSQVDELIDKTVGTLETSRREAITHSESALTYIIQTGRHTLRIRQVGRHTLRIRQVGGRTVTCM